VRVGVEIRKAKQSRHRRYRSITPAESSGRGRDASNHGARELGRRRRRVYHMRERERERGSRERERENEKG
jgi:hypothetical protein